MIQTITNLTSELSSLKENGKYKYSKHPERRMQYFHLHNNISESKERIERTSKVDKCFLSIHEIFFQ